MAFRVKYMSEHSKRKMQDDVKQNPITTVKELKDLKAAGTSVIKRTLGDKMQKKK